MKRRPRNFAFTLLELMLVLVIIAVCVTLAAPALRAFAHGRGLSNTAQDLVSSLHYCRVQAISEGTTYRLYLDPDKSKWLIAKDDGTGTNNNTPVNNAVLPAQYTLPADVTMETNMLPRPPDNMRYISFDAGGHADVTVIALRMNGSEIDITTDAPLSPYHVVGG